MTETPDQQRPAAIDDGLDHPTAALHRAHTRATNDQALELADVSIASRDDSALSAAELAFDSDYRDARTEAPVFSSDVEAVTRASTTAASYSGTASGRHVRAAVATRGRHAGRRTIALSSAAVLAVAALLVSPATAAPPAKPQALGQPGLITVIRYTGDGTTILSKRKLTAHTRDSSGEVATDGAISEYDDGGRPEAPLARPEALAQSPAQAAIVRQLSHAQRKADCCSPDGCEYLDVTRDIYGGLFWWTGWDWMGTFHHSVYWCWDYPRITYFDAGCWSEVNGSVINNNGCSGYGWFYRWAGADRGGHYSFRQADWDNCVFHYGCFKGIYPWIEIWVNGNGAWTQEQGG
jgi:hypothetical protein